jgi:acyl CoA:acetate/3-ketoacid CoA transferase
MNASARPDIVRVVEFGGEEWLHVPNIVPNVGILRGTTADEDGNVSMEHEGAVLGAVDVALAVRNSGGVVIAQVKRTTARGSIPPQRVIVPSTLVDFVVVDPQQKQATEIAYDPALSGEVRRPQGSFAPVPFGPDKVIARRAAMELRGGDVVNLGFGISPLVPYVLIEEGLGEAVTWAIEQGPVGGVPADGFPFGCAYNAQAILSSPQQFTFFQGGGSDIALLSFLEIGQDGSVNVSKLALRPHVTAGCGGFVDITARARRMVFSGYFRAGGIALEVRDGGMRIAREGRHGKLVPAVEQVTFNGARALAEGRQALYVTERCVLELRPAGLTVIELAPGTDLDRDVLAQAGFPLQVADDLRLMDARLFRPEPIGLALPENPRRASLDRAAGD